MQPLRRRAFVLAAAFALALAACTGGDDPPTEDEIPVGTIPPCQTDISPGGIERTTCLAEPRPQNWWSALIAEVNDDPPFDGELNGIRIGPSVDQIGYCDYVGGLDDPRTGDVAIEDAAGTPLEIAPSYLPDGVEVTRTSATRCADEIVGTETDWYVPADLSIPRWGGFINISRSRQLEPRVGLAGLGITADRAEAVTVAGRPAVRFPPLNDEGWGNSALVIREDWGITFLFADGVAMPDLTRTAESLYEE